MISSDEATRLSLQGMLFQIPEALCLKKELLSITRSGHAQKCVQIVQEFLQSI